jgi:hypothetical protein
MARVSSRTGFASLQKVFAQGRSPLMDGIAQLSVLYEDLRIETFALTSSDEEVKRLDCLDKRYRVNYFLRRSIATLFEFRGALIKTWKTDEFKAAHATATDANAPLSLKSQKVLFDKIADSLRFFERHHLLIKALRNAVGGHFNDDAAALATRNLHPDAVSKLEIIFHPSGTGGGPKLHYAGEIAATAFTKSLPGIKPRAEAIEDAICMIRDAYSHATQAMHALIVLFLWDRFH